MRKLLLSALLGAIMVLTVLASRGLNIAHWEETEWDVSSYDVSVPILTIIGGICFAGITFLTARGNVWMWFLAVSWVVFGLILAGAMYFI